jgi:hypothetical protein
METQQRGSGPAAPAVEHHVRQLLCRASGRPSIDSTPFIRAGMSLMELVRLHELVSDHRCRSALEVGMGHGTSSVVLCDALKEQGGRLISIDPFQTAPPPDGFGGGGLKMVEASGHEGLHRLIERPDYLALPELVEGGERFDFILIDGYHSFDYTLLDIFFADLLLEDGGILAVHDTTSPPVYRAVRFLETHKPYERLSAPLMQQIRSPFGAAARRLKIFASGRRAREGARSRRRDWLMLSAHRKLQGRQVPEYIEHRF